MCVFVCMYINIYNIRIHTRKYIYINMCVCTHSYIHGYIYAYLHTYILIDTLLHTHTYVCTCTHKQLF